MFNTKYNIPFRSKTKQGNIYIKKKDYVGESITLKLMEKGIDYNVNLGGNFLENRIVKQNISFQILNDAPNFFNYIDLFEIDEREFQVLVIIYDYDTQITLFDGWLDSDVTEQKYIHNSTIRLTASNYLSKLDNISPTIINSLGYKTSLIDIVNDSLKLTGKENNIIINNSLFPTNQTYDDNKTIYNVIGVDNELFWKNNEEKEFAIDIIKNILISTDSYIYWFDNKWWIERYGDIGKTLKNVNEYDNSLSYNYNDTTPSLPYGTIERDIQSLTFLDKQQSIQMIPGLKQFNIKLNYNEYNNLTINDFSDAIEEYTGWPTPDLRKWKYWQGNSYLFYNYPKYKMINSIMRTDCEVDINYTPHEDINYFEYHRGLSTKIKCTITPTTILELEWKSATNRWNGYFQRPEPSEMFINYMYYLRIAGTDLFIVKNNDTNEWYIRKTWEKDGCNRMRVNSSNAIVYNKEDIDYFLNKVTETINIGEIYKLYDVGADQWNYDYSLSGDFEIILNIGVSIFDRNDGVYAQLLDEYIGDVIISAKDTNDYPNLIEYNISASTLNKKEIDFNLFEIPNLNFKNGLFTNNNYTDRVLSFNENGGSVNYDLPDWFAYSKFQLYNKNRKKITGTIKHQGNILKPFDIFYDSYDNNRKYLLVDFTYYPTIDRYKVTFLEYNNNEDILINE